MGTNDCKPNNWNLENFKRDFLDLCKTFRNMQSKPDVFVIIPPPVYKDGFGGVNTTQTNKILPTLIPPIAKECGLEDG
jgi:alpha-L-fucosidase 2